MWSFFLLWCLSREVKGKDRSPGIAGECLGPWQGEFPSSRETLQARCAGQERKDLPDLSENALAHGRGSSPRAGKLCRRVVPVRRERVPRHCRRMPWPVAGGVPLEPGNFAGALCRAGEKGSPGFVGECLGPWQGEFLLSRETLQARCAGQERKGPPVLPENALAVAGGNSHEWRNFADTFVQLGRGFLPLGVKPLRGAFFPAILFL